MARLQLIYVVRYGAIEMACMALFTTCISHSLHLFIQIDHFKAKSTFPKKVADKMLFSASLIPVKILQQHVGKQHSYFFMLL